MTISRLFFRLLGPVPCLAITTDSALTLMLVLAFLIIERLIIAVLSTVVARFNELINLGLDIGWGLVSNGVVVRSVALKRGMSDPVGSRQVGRIPEEKYR